MTGAGISSPWHQAQLRVLCAVNVVGAVLLVGAWGGSGSNASLTGQIPWLDVAVVATALVAGTDAVWLATGRREVLSRRGALLGPLLDVPRGSSTVSDTGWLQLPGSSLVHRAGCLLIVGKPAVSIPTGTARATGLRPCDVCTEPQGSPR